MHKTSIYIVIFVILVTRWQPSSTKRYNFQIAKSSLVEKYGYSGSRYDKTYSCVAVFSFLLYIHNTKVLIHYGSNILHFFFLNRRLVVVTYTFG